MTVVSKVLFLNVHINCPELNYSSIGGKCATSTPVTTLSNVLQRLLDYQVDTTTLTFLPSYSVMLPSHWPLPATDCLSPDKHTSRCFAHGFSNLSLTSAQILKSWGKNVQTQPEFEPQDSGLLCWCLVNWHTKATWYQSIYSLSLQNIAKNYNIFMNRTFRFKL